MSDSAPGGAEWSTPVETSDETSVNLTIVNAQARLPGRLPDDIRDTTAAAAVANIDDYDEDDDHVRLRYHVDTAASWQSIVTSSLAMISLRPASAADSVA